MSRLRYVDPRIPLGGLGVAIEADLERRRNPAATFPVGTPVQTPDGAGRVERVSYERRLVRLPGHPELVSFHYLQLEAA